MGIWHSVGYFICKGTTRLFDLRIEPKPVQMTLDRFDTCDSGIRLAIGICCGGGLA